MNDIRPFRGLRYSEGMAGPLGELLCPPYDIISPLDQIELHGRSRFNAVRLELGLEFPEDEAGADRYTRARFTLDRWLGEGVLRRESQPCLYLHEQRFDYEGKPVTRRGLFARLRLATWEEGTVLPHEETMTGPKEDRLRLMRATECNLSPLFLLFEDPSGIVAELMGDLAVDRFQVAEADTGDGSAHRLWAAAGADQTQLAEALRHVQLFVADGHHRYETALEYRDERRAALSSRPSSILGEGEDDESAAHDYVLVLLVDARDPGLLVLPTHRLVRGLDPARLSAVGRALPALFHVESVNGSGGTTPLAETALRRMRDLGEEGPVLGLYRSGSEGVALLRPRVPLERTSMQRPPLDVDYLHDMLLAPLGIGQEQLREGGQVSYTRDAAGALESVDRGDAQLACLLNPTGVEKVLETARARGKMPQKSTYFYPKPPTGLVFNSLR